MASCLISHIAGKLHAIRIIKIHLQAPFYYQFTGTWAETLDTHEQILLGVGLWVFVSILIVMSACFYQRRKKHIIEGQVTEPGKVDRKTQFKHKLHHNPDDVEML